MDYQPIVIATIVAVPPTLLGAAALVQASKTHGLVNSRMDQLLELTKRQSSDAATLNEKKAQSARESAVAISEMSKKIESKEDK